MPGFNHFPGIPTCGIGSQSRNPDDPAPLSAPREVPPRGPHGRADPIVLPGRIRSSMGHVMHLTEDGLVVHRSPFPRKDAPQGCAVSKTSEQVYLATLSGQSRSWGAPRMPYGPSKLSKMCLRSRCLSPEFRSLKVRNMGTGLSTNLFPPVPRFCPSGAAAALPSLGQPDGGRREALFHTLRLHSPTHPFPSRDEYDKGQEY